MQSGWSALFRTAFTRSDNAMLLSDDERRIIEVNPAFARMLAMPADELAGRRIYEFVVGGPLLSHEEWKRTIQRNEVAGEAELTRGDGAVIRVQFAVHPETVTGERLVLFVALSVPRWARYVRRGVVSDKPPIPLSAREREVVRLVALGATSPQIAETLNISGNTVRKHVANAMRKLGARSRAHLVAKVLAERDGLSEPSTTETATVAQ